MIPPAILTARLCSSNFIEQINQGLCSKTDRYITGEYVFGHKLDTHIVPFTIQGSFVHAPNYKELAKTIHAQLLEHEKSLLEQHSSQDYIFHALQSNWTWLTHEDGSILSAAQENGNLVWRASLINYIKITPTFGIPQKPKKLNSTTLSYPCDVGDEVNFTIYAHGLPEHYTDTVVELSYNAIGKYIEFQHQGKVLLNNIHDLRPALKENHT